MSLSSFDPRYALCDKIRELILDRFLSEMIAPIPRPIVFDVIMPEVILLDAIRILAMHSIPLHLVGSLLEISAANTLTPSHFSPRLPPSNPLKLQCRENYNHPSGIADSE